jgi:hypothetical protein
LASEFSRWSAGIAAADASVIVGQPDVGFLMPTVVTTPGLGGSWRDATGYLAFSLG